jgi:hypothetical protein
LRLWKSEIFLSLSLLKGIETSFLGYPARSHVICKKTKVKVTLEQVMKAQRGVEV